MVKKKIFYIADFSLPNKSAYSLHVLKICDAFSEFTNNNVELLIPFLDSNYSIKKIKKDYLLKYNLKIKFFFSKKEKLHVIKKIFFSLKLLSYIKKNSNVNLIISRSIIASLILAIFGIKNILEIHTELTGFTKIFFFLTKFKIVKKNLNFIFINDYLRKKIKINKKKSLILCDAVDYRDFKVKNLNLIKNTCFYSGSFAKGKCLEIILKLSKELPNINFHLHGNKQTIYDKSILDKKMKNVFFNGYLTYSELVKKIRNYKVLLMPYKKNVGVLIKNINVANYFSPLKMFDYLASGKTILASDLPVYRNILKNNRNSVLVKPDDIKSWKINIIKLLNDKKNKLGNRALIDVKKFSWQKRTEKIINFNNKQVKDFK